MESEAEFARQREEMVRRQIERRGIRDPRLLEAMRGIPRHCLSRREKPSGLTMTGRCRSAAGRRSRSPISWR